MESYRPRLLDSTLAELVSGLPAVMLVGPRASGKTTSAERLAATTVRLDRALEAGPFRDDPDTVLRSLRRPTLLDEWQEVPEVLASVKRAVDRDSRPGQFLITGSARAEQLVGSWAATGRVVRLQQWGLCQRELVGNVQAPSFFDLAFDGRLPTLRPPEEHVDLREYVDLALRGGFPALALQPSPLLRRRWAASYVDQLLLRDATISTEARDPVRLRRYLTSLAANTAGVVDHKTIYDAAGISRETAVAYESLLELLFVTERVPAFHRNTMLRLVKGPKRYVIEPALLGPLLGLDTEGILRNGDMLGRLIDSFVLSQLRPELEVSDVAPRLFHLRRDDGSREIDLVAEAPDGRIVAIEIKSSAAPTPADARHLRWLHESLGSAFVAGIVFHTGPRAFKLESDIHALPISTLWGTIEA
jgi:uncharacterized protein